ncbi:MAG: hypothetical protein V1908_01435 [Candidatus Peregrinibacteria bacterium]
MAQKNPDPVAHNEKVAGNVHQPLEQIKLREVNGIRRAIGRALAPLIPAVAVGIFSGAVVGNAVENEYHELTGYSHNPPSQVEPAPTPEEENEEETPKQEGRKSESLQKARDTLTDAKKTAQKAIKDAAEHTQVMQKYREVRRELDRWKEIGDKTAYWLPFLMVFLAATLLANKLIRSWERLFEPVDPVVAANLRTLESTANALVARANTLSALGIDTSGEVARLAEHAQRLVPGLDDAMRQIERE